MIFESALVSFVFLQRIYYNGRSISETYQCDTLESKEDYVDGIIRVYNNEIFDVIDNYNCSAFYEPSYVVARAYQAGGF